MFIRIQQKGTIAVALLGSRGIPARYGGFETIVEELANCLPKHRFRLYVACENNLKGVGVLPSGVRQVYFSVSNRFRIISEIAYDALSLTWSAFASLDVVLIFGYAASVFCLMRRILGKTTIVSVDGLEWKRRKFPRFVRWALMAAEGIAAHVATVLVCDSRTIRQYYQQKYGVNPIYIPNPARECTSGTDVSMRELGLEPGGYCLVVARLEPENNIHVIRLAYLSI